MTEIHGTCDPRFEAVRDAFADSLATADVGASVAVYLDDNPVVDIWGGYVDAARTTPWERDTITNVWSSTKPMTALCALILADQGVLDLDAPVARYWPEFAAAGKEYVLVRHVLGHTAGLPSWDPPISQEDLYDRPRATALLAAQAPEWVPGTAAGYHSVTQGFLLAEIVRRVTGRPIETYFATEIAGPLGADFHLALAPSHDHRVAPSLAPPDSKTGDWIAGTPVNGPETNGMRMSAGNTEVFRRSGLSGFGNARSMAAVQSVLANRGTARGVRLLSEVGCLFARDVQFHGEDRILGVKMRYGMGYGVFGNVCGWGGWGGSVVMVDIDAGLTVAYAMNQMLDNSSGEDVRGMSFLTSAYDGVS